MQFGIWTPLPHTIRPEPAMDRAVALLKSGGREAGLLPSKLGWSSRKGRRLILRLRATI